MASLDRDPFGEHATMQHRGRFDVLGVRIFARSNSRRLLALFEEAFGSLPPHGLGAAAPRIDLTLSLSPRGMRVDAASRACGCARVRIPVRRHRRQQLRDGLGRAAARTDLRGSRHAGFSLPCALRAHGVRDLHPGAAGAGTGSLARRRGGQPWTRGAADRAHRQRQVDGLPELCLRVRSAVREDSVFLEPLLRGSQAPIPPAPADRRHENGTRSGTARGHPSLTGDSPQERRAEIRIRPAPFEHARGAARAAIDRGDRPVIAPGARHAAAGAVESGAGTGLAAARATVCLHPALVGRFLPQPRGRAGVPAATRQTSRGCGQCPARTAVCAPS